MLAEARAAVIPCSAARIPGRDIAKRVLDIAVAAVALVLLGGPMLLLAVLVSVTTTGPVISYSTRVGRNGHLFRLRKYRTRYLTAEPEGPVVTDTDDQELTPAGRFLRRTRLEWLPELLNILVGDMSVVGPRPHTPFFVEKFDPILKEAILSVRPGLLGATQLRFRYQRELLRKQADKRKFYVDVLLPIKCRMEANYVENRSLARDLKIAWESLVVAFSYCLKVRRLAALGSPATSGARAWDTLGDGAPTPEEVESDYARSDAIYICKPAPCR